MARQHTMLNGAAFNGEGSEADGRRNGQLGLVSVSSMKGFCDDEKIEVLAHDSVEEISDGEGKEIFNGALYNRQLVGGRTLEGRFQSKEGPNISFSQSFRRWSSNFGRSVKNNKRTVYNKTLRLMPSRMQKTLSVDGELITTSIFDVDHITMELGQREQLMENNPVAEQLRIEAIKSIAQKISTKRQIREHLAQTVHQRATSGAKSVGLLRRYRYSGKVYLARVAKLVKRFVTNFELFYGSMKQIEGHFGSRISAYFKFLRRLLVLNFVLLLFIASFVTFPQLLARQVEPIQSNASTPFHLRDLFTGEKQRIHFFLTLSAIYMLANSARFRMDEVLGYFTESVLYYGSYSNRSFTLVAGAAEYSLPHAYFLTITVLVLATFVVISVSMGRSYRTSFIESSATGQNILTHKIVCSWDYGIANAKAAQLKHASILHELRAHLDHRQRAPPVAGRWHRLRSTAMHALAHLSVLALISVVGGTLWALLVRFGETEHFSAWSALYVTLISNGTMVAFGYACQLLGRLEHYRQAATQLNINLLRYFLLQATIVGVLLAFWLSREHPAGCWETTIGQELYRLLVVDFLISTLLLTAVRVVRYVLHTRYATIAPFGRLTPPPFCIETHSLRLVYNQTLLWFGVLFAPLLVPVVALKFLLVFYVNKFELIYLCKPPVRLWRSSQTQTLLLVLVFVSLFGVLLTHGYIIMQVPVSTGCGPFRGTQYMYQLFMQGILKLREEHLFWRVFVYVTKPAIIGGVLLTMGVATYYLRAKSRAQIAKVRLLKELLGMEAKDKEFLLANLSKLARGKECAPEQLERIELLGAGAQLSEELDDRMHSEPCAAWRYEEAPSRKHSAPQPPPPVARTDEGCSSYHRFDDDEQLRLRKIYIMNHAILPNR